MSATKSPKDSFIYFPFIKLKEIEEMQLAMQFDMTVDYDIEEIKAIEKETKFLKKVCFFKLILALPEWLLVRIIFGKEEASYKKKINVLYWKFLRKKISIENLGKEMTVLAKSGKLI